MKIQKDQIEAGAKALWEVSPHSMLASIGYPIDWESQTDGIKADTRRKAKAVLLAANPPPTKPQER